MTTTLDKILYTAKAHSTGGRDASSRTAAGLLDAHPDPTPSMRGTAPDTNPETWFAAGYSA